MDDSFSKSFEDRVAALSHSTHIDIKLPWLLEESLM
jgi:hypothetical protein